MKQKGFSLIMVFIAITLVILIAAFLWIRGNEGVSIDNLPIPYLLNQKYSSPTPDLTVNWKTYRDPKEIFSFKYPGDWLVQPVSEGCGPVFAPPSGNTKSTKTWVTVCGPMGLNSEEEANLALSGNSSKLISRSNITIDNKNAIKQIVEVPNIQRSVQIYVGNVTSTTDKYKTAGVLHIYLFNQNLTSNTESEQIFDQILSTFKFTK